MTDKSALSPADTHVEGSGCLQTVHRETKQPHHTLISSVRSLTDVLLVRNTSVNENQPVVCRPEEALDCFLRTKMDLLVMESFLSNVNTAIGDHRARHARSRYWFTWSRVARVASLRGVCEAAMINDRMGRSPLSPIETLRARRAGE